MIVKPTTQWSAAIELPTGPSILRVNSGSIRLVYNSNPETEDDGQCLHGGDTVTLGGMIGTTTVRMKALNAVRDTEVYIGPWWTQ